MACEHDWQVQEDGYTRAWSTTIDPDTKTIRAAWGGSSDFSSEGNGELLRCTTCLAEKPIPEGWSIAFV
ncbi:hypothetical protein SEA_VANLEE_136 [Gordonia phage VanLee]|uniref:Uncharacterized protein n=1 Tax=Gordonia phage VanLee TaxID=2845816 RepID=A0A8F2DAH6_9CAUD|nr:hypothetical protein QEH49_gp154 [Gordonia phage VanLee]QWS68252.1 hypothetical protein SEA_VANLEE_136 [Gordonia phage VanLee]